MGIAPCRRADLIGEDRGGPGRDRADRPLRQGKATKTWKKTFGHHPLLGFVDHGDGGTGEPVTGLLRAGNTGSNTAIYHLAVLDEALAQIPATCVNPTTPAGTRCWCAPTPQAQPITPSPNASTTWGWPGPGRGAIARVAAQLGIHPELRDPPAV